MKASNIWYRKKKNSCRT